MQSPLVAFSLPTFAKLPASEDQQSMFIDRCQIRSDQIRFSLPNVRTRMDRPVLRRSTMLR